MQSISCRHATAIGRSFFVAKQFLDLRFDIWVAYAIAARAGEAHHALAVDQHELRQAIDQVVCKGFLRLFLVQNSKRIIQLMVRVP